MEIKLHKTNKNTNWDQYLNDIDLFLKSEGFEKYKQNYKREDFAYWKKYDGYQIGLLIYDFRKYPLHDSNKKIMISFECMMLNLDSRCDLSVSSEISLSDFENMAKTFYNAMIDFYKN